MTRSSLLALAFVATLAAQTNFRPPAVPLITHDPYFSIWSMNDHLTDGPTRHWTGTPQPLTGLIRIDGQTQRWMGSDPRILPALPQIALDVTPTRTVYTFAGAGIQLKVAFLSPLLPRDMEIMSRPLSYLLWEIKATDERSHAVELYLDASSALAVNTGSEAVVWSRSSLQGMDVLRVGSYQQPVLATSGDNLRIDWGYFYLAMPNGAAADHATESVAAAGDETRQVFESSGDLPASDDFRMPRREADQTPVLAMRVKLPRVGAAPLTGHFLLAYDDLYSIEYFHRQLRPYWRRNGMDMGGLLTAAEHDLPALDARTHDFDQELLADATRIGGIGYAHLATLAFRQAIAAHKLVSDFDGTPLLFSKENFSNGCIDTVDVTYPASPVFLLLNPRLLEAQLRPVLDYARSPLWHFPFAPHDLGTYPLANGQVYGGGERTETNQMPVEESGNMLLLLGALAQIEGNSRFAAPYWPQLRQWAEYLNAKGLDPENQLSTDDFAGHLAHNTNLSLKAILALGAYAKMAAQLGHGAEATRYHASAVSMAQVWVQRALDGDHYKLAFDKPGTWSQKYNLVWDRLLDLNLFPADVARTEMGFYKRHLHRFGLPLDNRSTYTKLDWEVWTATLTDNPQDFQTLIAPIVEWLNVSPSRVPLTDWYWTDNGEQRGFQARSVVGGVFIPLLAHPDIWRKWALHPATPSSSQ